MIDQGSALLAWMSHLGEGSKDQFDRAVDSLRQEETEQKRRDFRTLAWRRDIELGHICRTAKGWRVEPPTLSLLPSGTAAVWRGGRVEAWLAEMHEVAHTLGIAVEHAPVPGAPPRLLLSGDEFTIRSLATLIGADIEEKIALRLLAAMSPVAMQLRFAARTLLPTAGAVDYFDYDSMAWTEEPVKSAARRHTHPKRGYGYFVELEAKNFIEMSNESEAVHRGAVLDGRILWRYDSAMRRLETAWPLPIEISLPLCLCRGLPAKYSGMRRIYENVPSEVGLLLDRVLGGERNKVRWL